jgi:hypothetical protein
MMAVTTMTATMATKEAAAVKIAVALIFREEITGRGG